MSQGDAATDMSIAGKLRLGEMYAVTVPLPDPSRPDAKDTARFTALLKAYENDPGQPEVYIFSNGMRVSGDFDAVHIPE